MSNQFNTLNAIGMGDKEKVKNNLTYIDWASIWGEMKKVFPDANYEIHRNQDFRPWFDDGRTGWVTVTVSVPYEDGKIVSHTVDLPIMDFKNKSIDADKITSFDANKSWQRCLVKACAMHGLGLYVYAKLEDTEENMELVKLRKECMQLITQKAAVSKDMAATVAKVCTEADPDANGDPRLMEDVEVLKRLARKLKAIRVAK